MRERIRYTLAEKLHHRGIHALCRSRRELDRWVPLATPVVLPDGSTYTPNLHGLHGNVRPVYREMHG